MEINFAHALGAVRLAAGDAAQRAAQRRLAVYGDRAPCKPGCSGCCSRLLEVTVAEGVLLYESLVESRDWPRAREAAVRQFRTAQSADPVAWFKMNIKCPVLAPETQTCSAYAVRPALCSTHFVTSPASSCDPWSSQGGPYEPADMPDLFADFMRRVGAAVDGHGIMGLAVPLPVALLLAERITVQSGLTLDEAVSLLYNEFSPR